MATKTLRVQLGDLLGPLGPVGGVSGEVWARYSSEVRYTDGTIVVLANRRVPLNSSGVVDFTVTPNDDASVGASYQGFGIVVGWDLSYRGEHGQRVQLKESGRTIAVTSADPAVVAFGLKAPAIPVIPATSYIADSAVDAWVASRLGDIASATRVAGDAVYVKRDAQVYNLADHVTNSGNVTSALNTFIASLADGDEVLVGKGTWRVDGTLTIGKKITLRLRQGAVIDRSSGSATVDGIAVTTAGVTIEGAGSILSPATFDGTNVTPTYAVIHVTADQCTVKGVTLTNVPKVGIYFDDCDDPSVDGVTVVGNYPAGSYTGTETGHFGVAYNPGASGRSGRARIRGNLLRSCVQGVFIGNYGATATGALGATITANVFEGCHNHGVYNAGGIDGCTVTGNSFARCALPVALTGTGHTVTGNALVTMGAGNNLDLVGISMREAIDCTVMGNTIKGDAPTASVIIDVANFTGTSVRGNVVSGNTIDVTGGSASGIRVGRTSQTTDCSDNLVANNTIRSVGNAGVGLITVASATGGFGNKVTGNTIVVKGESHGIYVTAISHATVQGNSIRYEYDVITPVALTASCISTDTTLTISSNANFPGTPFTAILEAEQVTVTASTSTTATVTRGVNSTTAAAHASGVFMRLPATKTLGAVVFNATANCTASGNDVHNPSTFGANVALRGVWEQGASSANRIIQNGYHGDLTKLTSFTPIVLITNSDAYLDERGAGSPSGAFYGAPGSRWSRTDGGASTSLYVKETANTSATWAAK